MKLKSAKKYIVLTCLFTILIFSLFIRLSGIGWGLPDGTLPAHRSSNLGDENAILIDTLTILHIIRGSTEQLFTHKFYYQEGWIGSYLRLGLLGTTYLAGYIQYDNFNNREIGGYNLINFRRIFLVTQLVSIVFAVLTIALVYIIRSKTLGSSPQPRYYIPPLTNSLFAAGSRSYMEIQPDQVNLVFSDSY